MKPKPTREAVSQLPFSAFIRARKRDILAAWERAVREMPVARNLDRPALIDHVPDLLDRVAEMAEELAAGTQPRMPADFTEAHALERLHEGFDLSQVVAEYDVLRDCIVRLWEAASHDPDSASLRALNQAIDRSVAVSIRRFTLARDRTLTALDRISAAALETRSLDELLDRLIHVLLETTAAIDTATILLREGDVLRIRATVGLEDEMAAGWSMRIGEGFAGAIAQTRQPHAVESAATDPLVASPGLRARGIKGLFGVPMIEAGEVIGVAHMGSLTAATFSTQDQRLFAAFTHRATSAITLHMLREQEQARRAELEAVQAALEDALREQHAARAQAERTLAVIDTILAASSLGIAFIDTELRYVRINDALAALNGIPAEQHVGRTLREVLGDRDADLMEPQLRRVLETREPIEGLELDAAPPSTPDQVRSFVSSYVPVVTLHGELLGLGAVVIEVTEQKRMQDQLRERELQFRSVADNIPQLAWMADETGALTWYNRRWYEYTGTTFEQVRGWGWESLPHPDHAARVLEKFRRHLASGEAWEDSFPLRGADGRYRWFLSRAMPIRDELGRVVRWFGTNTDVTEHRFMQEATNALSSSLDYHATLEHVARLAVPALGDWCGIDVVEDTGVERIATAHADPARLELARELAIGSPGEPREPEHGQLRIARALGLTSFAAAPLIARDRALGVIGLASAQSGRRYTPADLAVLEELGRRAGLAVDNARLFEEAQRESRMREEVLAVVSHDLKNPLSAVHLAATMLLEGAEPRTRKHLETIRRASSRMDHLIGDLLDMASIQAGRLSVDRRPEDADAIVREVFEANEPMARDRGIALVRRCELPGAKLCADRERILQVFGNLVGNAIKFGRAGDTITIRCEHRGSEAEFAVADSGPGISSTELPHIFEPYWSAKKYARKGTGLGLYISKGITEAHGGRIWAESQPGAGTTFYFTIPFA